MGQASFNHTSVTAFQKYAIEFEAIPHASYTPRVKKSMQNVDLRDSTSTLQSHNVEILDFFSKSPTPHDPIGWYGSYGFQSEEFLYTNYI